MLPQHSYNCFIPDRQDWGRGHLRSLKMKPFQTLRAQIPPKKSRLNASSSILLENVILLGTYTGVLQEGLRGAEKNREI